MERKLFVINNPTSGSKSRNRRVMQEIKSFLEAHALNHQLFETTKEANAQQMVHSHFENEFTDLVIVGGDGTFNEAINGLTKEAPVTFIPAGTGNDFVKNLPMGKTLRDQLAPLTRSEVIRIDIGMCNGRKFLNGVGIGFDGQIVEDMAKRRVPLLTGHAKYYYHVLGILASYKAQSFDYQLDGVNNRQDLILMTIGNGTTFGGGFKLMPNAKIDDGLLEVCTIGPISGLRRFLNIHKLSNGTHESLEAVSFLQAKTVDISANQKLYAHIDGERMGTPPFNISILPKQLQVRI